MCGILGIIGNYDKTKIEDSLAIMRFRGPDGSKLVEFNGGCFAQNRLSIIAPSHIYDPPFKNEKSIFVFNGELYNYKTIQKEFALDSCESDSLTALMAFEKDSQRFLAEAKGMFALAHYDKKSKTLLLARDRFGKKPLYYAKRDSVFIFASSLDSIKANMPLSFRKESLKSFLSFHAPISPESAYNDVYKLQPGHTLKYDGKNIEISRYFNIFHDSDDDRTIAEIIDQSVSDRLVASVEVGAFLSGGVDSSSVCAIAAKKLAKDNKRLKTFCIGYDGFEKDDERRYARATAKMIGSDHHEILFGKNDFFDNLDKVIAALDEPVSDPASVPLYMMSSYAGAKGLKCVLSGEGGDEAFLGYEKHRLFDGMMKAKELPFNSYLGGFFDRHVEQNREWEWYRRIFGGEIAYRGVSEGFTDKQKIAALNAKVSTRHSEMLLKNIYDDYQKSSNTDYSVWMSGVDIHIWLSEVLLQKADKIGMANSLEIRCPLMDHSLQSKLLRLGDARFGNDTKWMLKEIVKDLIPQEIIDREKKGFSYPFNRWIFEDGDPEMIFRLNDKTHFFHKKYLDFLYKNAKKGSFKHQFWSIYLFSKWFESRFA